MSDSYPIDSSKRVEYFSFARDAVSISAAVLLNIRDEIERLRQEQITANSLARQQLRTLDRIDRRLATKVKIK